MVACWRHREVMLEQDIGNIDGDSDRQQTENYHIKLALVFNHEFHTVPPVSSRISLKTKLVY